MKIWIIVLICLLVGGGIFEAYYIYKIEQANRQKLEQAASDIEQLNKTVKFNDALVAQQYASEKERDDNLNKDLNSKKNQLKALQAQLAGLRNHPDLDHKKELAAAYLNKEKGKVADLQTQIKSFEDGRRVEQSGARGAEQNLDVDFHQQDAALATRINLEQQTLTQLNAQLAQIKVVKSDPSTQDAYNTQKQAIAVQKSVVDNFKQQRTNLTLQHNNQKSDMQVATRTDSACIDTAEASLKQDLDTEKKFYDQADKANRDAGQTLDNTNKQIHDLQSRIESLQNEIHNLELRK